MAYLMYALAAVNLIAGNVAIGAVCLVMASGLLAWEAWQDDEEEEEYRRAQRWLCRRGQ